MWERIGNEARDALERFEAEGWLAQPATYHETPPPLRRPRVSTARLFNQSYEHIRFRSGYAPHPHEPGGQRWRGYRANQTAHAWIFRHEGPPRPWLICVPGYTMGTPFVDLPAFHVNWLSRRLGLNVAIPVLPLHGLRRTGWSSGGGFFGADCMDTIHATAQAVWDIRRLTSWIRTQEAPRIGVYGVSLGGYVASLFACLEADLACVIAGIPATDFLQLARLHSTPALLLDAERKVGWGVIEQLFEVISPLAMQPLVPWEGRFIFAGRHDRITPPTQVRSLQRHWEQPRTTWYEGSHLSFRWEADVRTMLRRVLRQTLCAAPASLPLKKAG